MKIDTPKKPLRDRTLETLCTSKGITGASLAELLGVSVSAVRSDISHLVGVGLARAEKVRAAVGQPLVTYYFRRHPAKFLLQGVWKGIAIEPELEAA